MCLCIYIYIYIHIYICIYISNKATGMEDDVNQGHGRQAEASMRRDVGTDHEPERLSPAMSAGIIKHGCGKHEELVPLKPPEVCNRHAAHAWQQCVIRCAGGATSCGTTHKHTQSMCIIMITIMIIISITVSLSLLLILFLLCEHGRLFFLVRANDVHISA